jgi:hypothetical protein
VVRSARRARLRGPVSARRVFTAAAKGCLAAAAELAWARLTVALPSPSGPDGHHPAQAMAVHDG